MEEEDVMKSVEYRAEIEKARIQLRALMLSNDCAPIMLRLAWSDAATYDKRDGSGGPNGSIRFEEEYSHEVNNGLKIAIDLCEEVKSKHPMITYADLYQLAGVVAVEVTGGPTIDFIHGRRDSTICTREGRLPEPRADEDHLRSWFYRMGLSDRDIVALSGAHTLGRAHNERSGFEGPWTHEPLKFDNSYYVELRKIVGEGLVKLPTDICIIRDPALRKYVLEYSNVCITEYLDQELFFRDYAESHKKFSELGMREKKRAEQRRNAFEVAFGLAVAAAVVVLASIYDGRRIR